MGKVKGEEKFPNEVLVNNRRRKKRRKELDLLRRNVLENKRKLDNKTQGFDTRGRRSGLKKICNRLLPSRKPQVGIFANGARGAEIKRVNLSLNELDRARFEGDLQRVLDNGKRKCEQSRSDVLEDILHKPSAEAIEMETQEFIKIEEKNLHNKPKQNFVTARQSGKRKLQVSTEFEEKTAKKPHSQIEDTKVVVEHTKVKSERKNLTNNKWKRSLFQDEVDEFEPIYELGIEQLRFSPTIGQAHVKVHPSKPKVFPDVAQKPPSTQGKNFNYQRLASIVATKYEKLCAMVRAENFDTCLKEIPHIDPLTKVKQSLMDFYGETCRQKALRKHIKPEALFGEESANSKSQQSPLNIHKKNYSADEEVNLVRPKSEIVNVLQPRKICLGNLKKFSHRKEATESSSTQSKPPITKAREMKLSENINFATCEGPPSSEASIIENNTSSLDVNYDSSRRSFDSGVLDFFKIDQKVAESIVDLDRISNPRLAGIPCHRKKIILRYLKEMNDTKPLKQEGPVHPTELSAISTEDKDLKNCYFDDPLRGRERRTQQDRNPSVKELDELRGPPTFGAARTRDPLDVNFDGVGSRLGFDTGEFVETEGKVKPEAVNLSSASSSTLARIPSDRGQILLRFLQGVNNEKPQENKGVKLPPEFFVGPQEYSKHENYRPRNSSKNEGRINTSVEPPFKNGRHVPAILRKSQATKRNDKCKTAGNVFVKGRFEIDNLQWKASNFNFQKLSSESDATPVNSLFNKINISRKPPSTANDFRIDSDNSISCERVDFAKKVPQDSELKDRELPAKTTLIVNALHDLNNKGFAERRQFTDDRFANESSTIGQRNILGPSGPVNFPGEFKLQSPTMFRGKNSADKVPLSNFNNARPQSGDLPIFLHQRQHPDARVQRVPCDDKKITSQGSQESQRFPVFLKRRNTSSTQKRARHEQQHQVRPSQEKCRPKVVVIQKPKLRGYGEDVRHKMDMPHSLFDNKVQNAAGQAFSKFQGGLQVTLMSQAQPRNGRRIIEQFEAAVDSRENVCQQVERTQAPLCACKTINQQNLQQIQLPRNMYQNGMRKVSNRKYTAQELGNNSMNFFEQKTFDVPLPLTSGRMFQHDLSSNAEIPGTCVSSYYGNTNFEDQRNGRSAERVQLFDRLGFTMTETDLKSFRQSANNLPIISDQNPHAEDYNPVLSEDKNCNYKYIIDPRYPQAGYKWNQIDQSGVRIDQRVIQPAYNANDAYRP